MWIDVALDVVATRRTQPFGLYVHIPFCERKCPYCDFNTYAGLQARFQTTVDALCTELAVWQDPLAEQVISSVFLGGGTPTVLEDAQLVQLFGAIRRCFHLDEHCEITCEANPGTVDRAKFQLLRMLGVNRLSIGVQSFQPAELQFLGRIHDVDDVYRAVEAARAAGMDNINLDFIFGLPDQATTAWLNTLDQALTLAPEHLSLYSLIVEPNTPLYHAVETGKVDAPDDDRAAELYEAAMQRLAAADYTQYEVSNWASNLVSDGLASVQAVGINDAALTPTLACRHNLLYWRNQGYLGIGPGAHSHMRFAFADGTKRSRRWGNRKPVPGYVKRINADKSVTEFQEDLEPRISMGETMMLGLRLVREGVSFSSFHTLHGMDMRQVFAGELVRLEQLGLIEVTAERVRVTRHGLMVGNQVFASFLPDN